MTEDGDCRCDGSRGCLSCAIDRDRAARLRRDEGQEREADRQE